MNTVRLWLAASTCSLLLFSSTDARSDGPVTPGPRSTTPGPRARRVELPATSPRRQTKAAPSLPAFLALGSGARAGSPGATRFAAPPKRSLSACSARCPEPRAPDRVMARASRVLAGVAAAGVSAGIVLVLSRPGRSVRARVVPDLRLRVSGERAVASAGWRF